MENIQELLRDFGKLLRNMTTESFLVIVVSVSGTIGSNSSIKDFLGRLLWINENLRVFVLYPLALIITAVLYFFMAFLVVRTISSAFVNFEIPHLPKRKARIEFPIPNVGRKISLEIRNSEKKFALKSMDIRFRRVGQFPDRFGKLPIEEDDFDKRFSGLRRKPMQDRELTREKGGSVLSGLVEVSPHQSVSYYLFELDANGYMSIPQIKLRLGKFPIGSYLFEFEFGGYVERKRTPEYISVTVKNTGEEIVTESIEP